ncbi:hypothetical protein [Zavarzinia sp. CC-PAN008]|uniref:hypothetical protein n=1 Tax=Zavarzinia sp. CC-PAN008 TaxID=3243332 RepID=UPI003F7428E6
MAHPAPLSAFAAWLKRAPWNEVLEEVVSDHIGMACADANMSEDDALDALPEVAVEAIYLFAIEDLANLDLDDGRNAVDEFLKRRGYQLGSGIRAWLKALRQSHVSLHRVTTVSPGVHQVEDVLADPPAAPVPGLPPGVPAPAAGDALFVAGRILDLGGKPALGQAWLPIPGPLAERLSASIPTEAAALGLSVHEMLAETSALFTAAWLDDVLTDLAEQSIAGMVTAEGDPVAFMLATYALAPEADMDALTARLDGCPALARSEDGGWHWTAALAAPPADLGEAARVLPDAPDDLGSLHVNEEGALVLSVPSRQRMVRARTLLEPLLGSDAAAPVVEEMTYRQVHAMNVLAARQAEMDEDAAEGDAGGDEADAPAMDSATFQRSMAAHLRRLLDEPLEVIGNRVPRRAARSPTDRPLVVAWLRDVEKRMAEAGPEDPLHGMDVSWMWLELGLSRP